MEVKSRKEIKEILENVTARELAEKAYNSWFEQFASGHAVLDLETGEIKGLTLQQNESTSEDYAFIVLYTYEQNWEQPDIDELLDDIEYIRFLGWKSEKKWTGSEFEALEQFCKEKEIDLQERIYNTVEYWIEEGIFNGYRNIFGDWVDTRLHDYECEKERVKDI